MVSMPDSVVKYRLQVFFSQLSGVLTHDFLFILFTVHRLEAFWKTKIQTSKLFGEVDKSSGELVTLTQTITTPYNLWR